MAIKSLERGAGAGVGEKVAVMVGIKLQIEAEAEVEEEIVMISERGMMAGIVIGTGVVMMAEVEIEFGERVVQARAAQILLLQAQEFVINGKRLANVDGEILVDIFTQRVNPT